MLAHSCLFTGLAFIVIPEGLSKMPASVIWSMLFFAMLFLLGIDSQFAMVETVITFLFDSMVSPDDQSIDQSSIDASSMLLA